MNIYYKPSRSNSYLQNALLKAKEFLSVLNGIFSKIGHIFGQKVSFSSYKKTEKKSPYILSDHYRLKLTINNNKKSRKLANS